MRAKLIGLLIGCGLAALVAPALACSFNQTASSQSTSQETAQNQPAADTGKN